MSKILVTYYTRSGNTETMAEAIANSIRENGVEADLLPVEKVETQDLLQYQGFMVGSPVYYGLMAAPIKQLFDESVAVHGRLSGRAGAAFASSANIGGGNETTCMAILQMMLVHGMVTLGAAQGDHYGPCAIGTPDARVLSQCSVHGKRFVNLVKALDGTDLK